MGQYYKAINLDKKEMVTPQWVKLTEHSYAYNGSVLYVMKLLSQGHDWYQTRLVWCGDYVDKWLFIDGDYKDKDNPEKTLDDLYSVACDYFDEVGMSSQIEDYDNLEWEERSKRVEEFDDEMFNQTKELCYVINHTKQQMVDVRKLKQGTYGKLHPLPLLTAAGNGRGGGDFWGLPQHEQYIGLWAGDVLSAETASFDVSHFTEIVPTFIEKQNRLGESKAEEKLRSLLYANSKYTLHRLMELVQTYGLTEKEIPFLQHVLSKADVEAIAEQEKKKIAEFRERLLKIGEELDELKESVYGDLYWDVNVNATPTYYSMTILYNGEWFYKDETTGKLRIDLTDEVFETLKKETEAAFKSIIEQEKRVYCGYSKKEIDAKKEDDYYVCPICQNAILNDYASFNDEGILMCPTCVNELREFVLFTAKARLVKQTCKVGPGGDFDTYKEFIYYLNEKNYYAHDLNEYQAEVESLTKNEKKVTVKKALLELGWWIDDKGEIETPVRYSYLLKG